MELDSERWYQGTPEQEPKLRVKRRELQTWISFKLMPVPKIYLEATINSLTKTN